MRLTDEQREFVAKNIRLAYKFAANNRRLKWMEFDDWQSLCFLVLVRCAASYQPERGQKFSTYYYRSMRMEWSRTNRHAHYQCRDLRRKRELTEDLSAAAGLRFSRPAVTTENLEKTERQQQAAYLMARVPEEYSSTVREHLAGKTFQTMGDENKCSKQCMQSKWGKAIKHLRKIVDREGIQAAC